MKLKQLRQLIREEINLQNNWEHAKHMDADRKPISFDDIYASTSYKQLPPKTQEWVDGLRLVDGNRYERIYDINEPEQFYVIEKDGISYFVNTEGFPYPRYVGIIDYEDEGMDINMFDNPLHSDW